MKINNLLKKIFLGLFIINTSFANEYFIDKEYPVIDTKIEQRNDFLNPFWMDNNSVFLNAITYNKVGFNEYEEDKKIIFYNVLDNSSKVIEKNAYMACYNSEKGIAGLIINKIDQVVKVNKDASISTLKNQPHNIHPVLCRSDVKQREDFKSYLSLREEDGYIDINPDSKIGGSKLPIVLYSPNKPPKVLSVIGEDMNNGIRYYPFLNQYLLSYLDNRRVQGIDIAKQKRPFYLMSPNGDITTIPFPEKFATEVLKGEFFAKFFPVKTGYIIYRSAIDSTAGMYLLQSNKVTRIYGKKGTFISEPSVSPDGCKIAFVSYRRAWHGYTSKTFKILNVCLQGVKNDEFN